ncbi:hypothetical protein BP6252_02865 [Coleophoma cylindrospora]|uniref:PHD-type domain-containing protein n=1 Tax=Coleophoma cylindrospora TaxID=1849047 RepID=A0A3D8SG15_9HELO|nr:hypothetical protein BP6252_02865 [Coleophoma cylindrospora]
MPSSSSKRKAGEDRPAKRQNNGRKGTLTRPPWNKSVDTRDANADAAESMPRRSSPQLSAAPDPKALWLSVLTREELSELAAGAVWKPGDLHPHNCFVCNLADELLNCRHCPRSYHATCLDPPIQHSPASDDWACPACALLGVQGATHTYLLDQPYERENARRMARVEGTANIVDAHPDVNQEASDSTNFQIGTLQQPSAAPVQTKSRERVKGKQSRTFINPLNLDPSAPPKVVESSNSPGNGPAGRNNLTFVERPELSPGTDHQPDFKKRSRYSTLPNDVDEALATINRQLEAGVHSQNILEHVTARNQALEQELQIERGKVLLAARNEQSEAEMKKMKARFKDMERELGETREENRQLKINTEKNLKKINDLEAWKLRMKAMIDGDPE